MHERPAVYSNTQSIEELGRAFQGMTSESVLVPERDCQDVPKFIRQLQAAKDATHKHRIQFP
jgi:hypothetical protein